MVLQLDSARAYPDIASFKKDTSFSAKFFSKDTLYKYFDTVHLQNEVYFFAEGDILLREPEFTARLIEQYQKGTRFAHIRKETSQKVIIEYDALRQDTIKWEHFPIHFCIDKSSFMKIPGGYDSIKNYMLHAVNDWQNLCEISFDYEGAEDTKVKRSNNLDFVISYNVPGRPTNNEATSFFPNDPPENRNLFIFPKYWSSQNDKAGLLRHEIGHILGFLHEHASKSNLVPLDCLERYSELDIPSLPITQYDSFSVMHYFCGGAGTRAMQFSRNDTLGFQLAYRKR
jgi:hypothetical protein